MKRIVLAVCLIALLAPAVQASDFLKGKILRISTESIRERDGVR